MCKDFNHIFMKTLHLEGLSVFKMAHGKHEVDKSISSESFSIEILWPDHFLRCPKSQYLFFHIAHKFGRKTISQVFLAIIKSAHSFEESVFSCCSSIQLTMSEQGFGFSLKRIQNCWCTNWLFKGLNLQGDGMITPATRPMLELLLLPYSQVK